MYTTNASWRYRRICFTDLTIVYRQLTNVVIRPRLELTGPFGLVFSELLKNLVGRWNLKEL